MLVLALALAAVDAAAAVAVEATEETIDGLRGGALYRTKVIKDMLIQSLERKRGLLRDVAIA